MWSVSPAPRQFWARISPSTVKKDGKVYLNETVQVIITDIEASNGVIHVIDAVLLPPQ